MLDFIVETIFIIICVFIGSELICRFLQSLICEKNSKGTICKIIELCGHDEMVEEYIKSSVTEFYCKKPVKNFQIIVIDNGIDEHTKQSCIFLCNKYDYIKFTTKTELYNAIFGA